jgi:ubiquinone/menaquinone biosynthesis C-methylase UbiE
VDVWCDLTETLPFGDGEFETIILSDVLEHIPEPANLWKEMARVLSPSGKVLISVPFCYWIHERPYDYYRYTEYALRRFAEPSGFTVIALNPLGGAPEVVADILAKTVLQTPKIGRLLSASIQHLTSLLLKTTLGKAVSDATSASFPLEYFLVAEKSVEQL